MTLVAKELGVNSLVRTELVGLHLLDPVTMGLTKQYSRSHIQMKKVVITVFFSN
jgi:hypothetical protein